MILLLAAFAVGDAWRWNVDLCYEGADGPLLHDRERWSLRVGKDRELTAERRFLGTIVDDGALIPTTDTSTETLKGRIEADGTLAIKGDWSDPAATRALHRLLRPQKGDETVPGWPVVRRAILREPAAKLPGNDEVRAELRVGVDLIEGRLGGRELKLESPAPTGNLARPNDF